MSKERIRDLLGAGASQAQVAMAVGVEESYVSQLMADEDFRGAVTALRAEAAARHAATDARIDSIEDKAWKKIDSLIEFETNLMRLLKVAQAANAAKRRVSENLSTPQGAAPVVNITLPQSSLVEFRMSSDRQVVEIEGKALQAMPSAKIQELARNHKAKQLAEDTTPLIPSDSARLLAKF